MRWTWKHGLLLFVALDLAAFALPRLFAPRKSASVRHQQDWYRSLELPVFAPPGWVFPVAWTTNRAIAMVGIVHTANLPANTPGRRAYLRSQAGLWTVYVLFDPLFFTLRSPINGAILTTASTALAFSSLVAAVRIPRAAVPLVPTLAWLALALPLSVHVARDNPDPLWGYTP